jgi:hypothetical protein
MTKDEKLIQNFFKHIIDTHEIKETFDKGFHIYTAYNNAGSLFSFAYNKATNKYAIKRYKQMELLYAMLQVPFNIKPENFKEMYNLMHAEYVMRDVQDTVDALYDAIPYYYNMR